MPRPTDSMRRAARRGLALRSKQPPSRRGGTAVGLARARDFAAGRNVSIETVKRTYSFLSRHKKNYRPGTTTPGTQAYLLWGGPAGLGWARKILKKRK